MSSTRDLTLRRITPRDRLFAEAVSTALGWRVPASRRVPDRRIAEFAADCSRRGLHLDPVYAALEGDNLVSACCALESPGRAALLLFPTSLHASAAEAASRAVSSVCTDIWQRPMALLQALIPPGAGAPENVVRTAGFRRLTRLVYLERPLSAATPEPEFPQGIDWVDFTEEKQRLFERAIEATYLQSSDCPELTGIRTTAEVIAGHRAAGDFDARLWWVAIRRDMPVGVLLLARLPRQRSIEVAYMGVAQAARGTGVANALLHRALATSRSLGANVVTLAFDERNAPARRLYERWGFDHVTEREAWIATKPGAELYDS